MHTYTVPHKYKRALWKAIKESGTTVRSIDEKRNVLDVTVTKPLKRVPKAAHEKYGFVRKVA